MEIFLAVGNIVVTKHEMDHEHVFGILQEFVLGPENLLYDASNEFLDRFRKDEKIGPSSINVCVNYCIQFQINSELFWSVHKSLIWISLPKDLVGILRIVYG